MHRSPDRKPTRNAGRPVRLTQALVPVLAALVMLSANAARADMPARVPAEPAAGIPPDTLYVVAVSHLDTQWLWTIVQTIVEYIPATFRDTMDQLDRHPGYRFSFEGAHRYRLLREYYPDLWERLKAYSADGRWSPAGSALEGGDVNIPSPESLVRQFLYGNDFFRRELGRASTDVFLPDCFGFGWALPSVAAHCGLNGFSTQKLGWGSAYGIPFPVGRWRGPDGAEIVAALDGTNYVGQIAEDLSRAQSSIDALDREAATGAPRVGYRYFGTGDRGGPVAESSLDWLDASMAGTGPVHVVSAPSDRFFNDLSPEQVAALPVHGTDLLLTTHGTGAYTSQAAMKRWNRRNEQLGDAAERASLAASVLAAQPYPGAWLADAWFRFLVHQFHDDLTGTSIPEVYPFSWNDERIAQVRFGTSLAAAVGAIAAGMDTTAEGVPLVVCNATAHDRQDVVEARVRFPDPAPAHVRVFDNAGAEVPAQVLGTHDGAVDVAFLAAVPPVGFAVFDARPSGAACALATGLSVLRPGTKAQATGSRSVLSPAPQSPRADPGPPTGLENARYRIAIDANGDVSSVFDKSANREVLAGPVRLAQFDSFSIQYPAWEIPWENIRAGVREYVGGAPEVRVVEDGPARVAVEIRRTYGSDWGDSTYVLRVRLAAAGAADRVEWDASIDWATRATLLKAEFPFAATAPGATYDLGLGSIRRPNASATMYEVPAQQWADVTADDGSYGASVLSYDKTGWHKADDARLYLSLIHTPMLPTHNQHTNDLGSQRTAWALHGHAGPRSAGTVAQAERFGQPLLAFQTTAHAGGLGRSITFASVSEPGVSVRALKQAEDSDEVVVRVQETSGTSHPGVRVRVGPAGIAQAREVFGDEQPRGEATVDGGALVTDLAPFQLRSFALRLAPFDSGRTPPTSRAVDLPFDTDVASFNGARADGAFDPDAGIAWAAEQVPESLDVGGVRFVLGPVADGQKNAVACRGQWIPIAPRQGECLHLLAASVGDVDATFLVGDRPVPLAIQDHGGFVGQWDARAVEGGVVVEPVPAAPAYLKPAEIAWYGTHRHKADGDDVYAFSYLFRYVLEVPAGATVLTLPDDPRVKVLAATLTDSPEGLTVPASEMYDGFDPLHRLLAGWQPSEPTPEPVPETAERVEEPAPAEEVSELAEEVGQDVTVADVPVPDAWPDVAADVAADLPADTNSPDVPSGKGSGGCTAVAGAASPSSLAPLALLVLGWLRFARRRTGTR